MARQSAARTSSSGVRGAPRPPPREPAAPAPGAPPGPPCRCAVSGRASRSDEGRGDHVVGQARGERRAQRRRVGARPGRRPSRPPGGLAAGPSPRAVTTASRTPGQGGERRLDLAGLDAEAADLDLLVDAPQVLDVAARQAAGEVARAVEARARPRREGVGDEALGGELRTPQVAPGQAGAADVDLAGNADRRRLEPAVQEVDGEVGDRPADRR